jgi:hypothetical protein
VRAGLSAVLSDRMRGCSRRRRHIKRLNSKFLNRAAGPYWNRVRLLAENWYQRVPAEHRGDLSNRFRSKDTRSTRAAFWEIYLYEALLRHGYAVTVHTRCPAPKDPLTFLLRQTNRRSISKRSATSIGNAHLLGSGGAIGVQRN